MRYNTAKGKGIENEAENLNFRYGISISPWLVRLYKYVFNLDKDWYLSLSEVEITTLVNLESNYENWVSVLSPLEKNVVRVKFSDGSHNKSNLELAVMLGIPKDKLAYILVKAKEKLADNSCAIKYFCLGKRYILPKQLSNILFLKELSLKERQQLLNKSAFILNLSRKSKRIIRSAKINSIGDLLKVSKEKLSSTAGTSLKSLNEVFLVQDMLREVYNV